MALMSYTYNLWKCEAMFDRPRHNQQLLDIINNGITQNEQNQPLSLFSPWT